MLVGPLEAATRQQLQPGRGGGGGGGRGRGSRGRRTQPRAAPAADLAQLVSNPKTVRDRARNARILHEFNANHSDDIFEQHGGGAGDGPSVGTAVKDRSRAVSL